MRLVYFIQLVFLTLAFLYGYRNYLTPLRLVVISFTLQVLYGLLIYVLYYHLGVLTIFDFNRMDKETWLLDLIIEAGKANGTKPPIFIADRSWWSIMITGGFLSTLLTILSGGLLSRMVYTTRADYARSETK